MLCFYLVKYGHTYPIKQALIEFSGTHFHKSKNMFHPWANSWFLTVICLLLLCQWTINGSFHKAKRLKILDNIKLVFLPPYSPELNPAEKMWVRFKRAFTNKLFKSLEEISLFIDNAAKEINKSVVKSTCTYKYIFLTYFGMKYKSFWYKPENKSFKTCFGWNVVKKSRHVLDNIQIKILIPRTSYTVQVFRFGQILFWGAIFLFLT